MAMRAKRRIVVRRSRRRPVLNGLARIFDFTGSLNLSKRTLPAHVADRYALWSDWKAVGDDLRTSIGHHSSDRTSKRHHRSIG